MSRRIFVASFIKYVLLFKFAFSDVQTKLRSVLIESFGREDADAAYPGSPFYVTDLHLRFSHLLTKLYWAMLTISYVYFFVDFY